MFNNSVDFCRRCENRPSISFRLLSPRERLVYALLDSSSLSKTFQNSTIGKFVENGEELLGEIFVLLAIITILAGQFCAHFLSKL